MVAVSLAGMIKTIIKASTIIEIAEGLMRYFLKNPHIIYDASIERSYALGVRPVNAGVVAALGTLTINCVDILGTIQAK